MTSMYLSTPPGYSEHCVDDLVELFNSLFKSSENTLLVQGATEPVYIPASAVCGHHQVVFSYDYFSSALHELAHWCLAGKERRLVLDYGYWYAPDGRDQLQQNEFEKVEIKPQALEWIFSKCCGKTFRVSLDNLHGLETEGQAFKKAVYQQVLRYCDAGIPARAKILCEQLRGFYQTPDCLCPSNFSIGELD